MKNDSNIVLNIEFYDGSSENIEVNSSTTTDEIVKILANKKGIPTNGYTIFGVCGNKSNININNKSIYFVKYIY